MSILKVTRLEATARTRLATVALQTPLLEAAQRLAHAQIGLVVVCDPDGAMAGVISKTDVVRQIGHCAGSACRTLASDLMTREVVFCHPFDLLSDVLVLMRQHGLVHVPVIDDHGRPLGVLNARDALHALVADGEYEQSLLVDYVMGVGYH